jgi:hypothetical protein
MALRARPEQVRPGRGGGAAEAPQSAVVWYRASESCPDGASFVESTGEERRVQVHRRHSEGWTVEDHTGSDTVLLRCGVGITVADLYP